MTPRTDEAAQHVDHANAAAIDVLLVDDERTLRESCVSVLENEGYRVTSCSRADEAAALLKRSRFDIAVLDLYMPDLSGLELTRLALELHPEIVPIIITGQPTVNSNIESLQAGAWDYLAKPFSATQLQLVVGRASHRVLANRKAAESRAQLERESGNSEKITLLGTSRVFRKTIQEARTVARTDASVFLTGESGTGKELIAQFIHYHSRRVAKPLVALNCAALPETLLESEMFGHCRGSFTGAVRDKPGLLEVADGGTMFLDEILEMSLPIQAKLLRVLQDGIVRRVGSTKTDAVVDVRFIAAANRDPAAASSAGTLRSDLFFRLGVVPIRVPSLRERPDDIPILAEHFLKQYWAQHRSHEEPIPSFSEEALQSLRERSWPGNVRELENAVEHAVVFLEAEAVIQPEDIVSVAMPSSAQSGFGITSEALDEPYHDARERILAEFERRYLKTVINRADGNIMRAARIAGVDRTTLYRLMQKRGLRRKVLTADAD